MATSPAATPDRSTGAGPAEDDPGRYTSPSRVEALSDAVFAIVLTILVLEIAVPPNLTGESLIEVGNEIRATLVAWVISFLMAGTSWMGHRDLFSRLRVVTRELVWLNLLFLLPACLIPFAASVIGKYPDQPNAMYIYGIVMIAVTIMRVVLYHYVLRRPQLLRSGVGAAGPGFALTIAASPIALYALALALATTSTTASLFIFFSVPVLYFLLITALRHRRKTRSEAEEFS